jgi:DNA-binding NtrC family response regulator
VNTSSPYQPEQDISASDVSRQAKILVVEDEPTIQNLMTEFLKREGYMVDTASSAEEALAFLDVSYYNLIITDLGLPGMGGEKFLDELAKRNLGIPTIVASGYLRGKKVLESPERYGIVVTLSKPFSVGKLKEAVEKALSKRNQT